MADFRSNLWTIENWESFTSTISLWNWSITPLFNNFSFDSSKLLREKYNYKGGYQEFMTDDGSIDAFTVGEGVNNVKK